MILLYQVLDVFKTTTASTAATPPSDVIPASGQDVVIWDGEVTSTTGTSIDVLCETEVGEVFADFEWKLLATIAAHLILIIALCCTERIMVCLYNLTQRLSCLRKLCSGIWTCMKVLFCCSRCCLSICSCFLGCLLEVGALCGLCDPAVADGWLRELRFGRGGGDEVELQEMGLERLGGLSLGGLGGLGGDRESPDSAGGTGDRVAAGGQPQSQSDQGLGGAGVQDLKTKGSK